jgi:hypothetical protein
MRKWVWRIAGSVVLLAVAAVVVTGISLLPTSLALGPCFPDLTSPTTYRPRLSPLVTVDIPLAAGAARLCYGRPSARDREVYGVLVPFGELWRLGANEPTRLYTDHGVNLAGLILDQGRYSLYVVPGPERWTLHVTRSTTHWGNDLSAAVRAGDVGTVEAETTSLTTPVETLTVNPERRGDSTLLHFDWATTRVTLPLSPVGELPHE